jgi:hypothetical protein
VLVRYYRAYGSLTTVAAPDGFISLEMAVWRSDCRSFIYGWGHGSGWLVHAGREHDELLLDLADSTDATPRSVYLPLIRLPLGVDFVWPVGTFSLVSRFCGPRDERGHFCCHRRGYGIHVEVCETMITPRL